ncbi:MAG: glycosyltransferase [Microbacterium sp.]
MPEASPLVIVAVPTFRRPDTLARLLTELPGQQRDAERAHGVRTAVVVIDNDPAMSAEPIARGFTVTYVSQPERGLAAVRNAALDAAGDAEALVFIDDDETPQAEWLSTLVGVWRAGGVEFVSGRVVSTFAYPLDPWIDAGGFFKRVQFTEGQRMPFAATNNLLIDMEFLRRSGLRFDNAFALSGGEDIRLTSQAVAVGARIVATPVAVVTDPVPASRATRRWVLQRAFRVGTTTARCEILLHPTRGGRAVARVRWFAEGLVRAGAGAVRWVAGGLVRSLGHRARGARLVARGAGMCAGAFGMRYAEYRARHTAAAQDALQ